MDKRCFYGLLSFIGISILWLVVVSAFQQDMHVQAFPAQASSGSAVVSTSTAERVTGRQPSGHPAASETSLENPPAPQTIEIPVAVEVARRPEASKPISKAKLSEAERYPAPGPDYEIRDWAGSPTGKGWFPSTSPYGPGFEMRPAADSPTGWAWLPKEPAKKAGRWAQERQCGQSGCSLRWVWKDE
jgi:hypothetical protein